MSTKASAKIVSADDPMFDEVDLGLELDYLQPALVIGEPIDGAYMFITVHTCPHCHAKMQTIGAGHGIYHCSWCAGSRGRNIEMVRTYEKLEVME